MLQEDEDQIANCDDSDQTVPHEKLNYNHLEVQGHFFDDGFPYKINKISHKMAVNLVLKT